MNSNILITSLAIQCRLCVNAVHVIVAVGIRSRDRRSSLLSSFMSDGYEFQFYFNLHGWYGTVSSSCGGASSSMREKEGRCHLRLVSSLVLSPSSVVFCLQQRKEVIMLEIVRHCRCCRSIPILLLVSLQDYYDATNDELCKYMMYAKYLHQSSSTINQHHHSRR